MIGGGMTAMSGAAVPATAPMSASSNPPAENGAAQGGAASAEGTTSRQAAGKARETAAPANQGDSPESASAAEIDFAALLAASEPTDALAVADAPAAATGPVESAATVPPPAPSPDQLLALLGSLATPIAAPAAAQPSGGVPAAAPGATATPLNAAMAATSASALPFATENTPRFTANPAGAANQDGATPAVLAAALTDAIGAGSSMPDAAPPVEAFVLPSPVSGQPSIATTTPIAAPALAFPMDPETGFDDGFGARIAWMAEQRIGHAEIRLNPDNLGPIDVRVQVDGTRVTAEFHSTHAEVRSALEASVPRLREMLSQQGLQLGHADVGQGRRDRGENPAGAGRTDGRDAANASAPAMVRVRTRGLVDEYA